MSLDYLNQLKQFTTSPRNQSKEIYKNYRNEGVGNYPHMQDYERTMAQIAAQKEYEQTIKNQYEANKNKLIEENEPLIQNLKSTTENAKQRTHALRDYEVMKALKDEGEVTANWLTWLTTHPKGFDVSRHPQYPQELSKLEGTRKYRSQFDKDIQRGMSNNTELGVYANQPFYQWNFLSKSHPHPAGQGAPGKWYEKDKGPLYPGIKQEYDSNMNLYNRYRTFLGFE